MPVGLQLFYNFPFPWAHKMFFPSELRESSQATQVTFCRDPSPPPPWARQTRCPPRNSTAFRPGPCSRAPLLMLTKIQKKTGAYPRGGLKTKDRLLSGTRHHNIQFKKQKKKKQQWSKARSDAPYLSRQVTELFNIPWSYSEPTFPYCHSFIKHLLDKCFMK